MEAMQLSRVLVLGLGSLGVEIGKSSPSSVLPVDRSLICFLFKSAAKDVCLAGVRSVTLYDPGLVEIRDLGSNCFLRDDDVGKPRAQAVVDRLRELNRYVPVDVLEAEELTPEILSRFKVVVATDATLTQQLAIDDYTHAHGIRFISADVRGLFG